MGDQSAGNFQFQTPDQFVDVAPAFAGKGQTGGKEKHSGHGKYHCCTEKFMEMPLTMLLAKFYGASALSVGPCMPEGRALEHPELYLSDRQYRKLLSWATIFNGKFNIPVRFSYEQRCECYNTDGTPTGIAPESCTAGKTFMVISPDGMVRKCMHSPEKICSFEEFLTR